MSLLKRIGSALGGKPAAVTQPPAGNTTAGGAPSAEEITIRHVWCEEPNALKFLVGTALLPMGQQRAYASVEEAADSPMARALFEVPGVTAVRLDTTSVSVELKEDADWEGLHDKLPGMIRKFISAGGSPVVANEAATGKRYKFGFKQVTSRPREEQIRIVQELFDHEVNPAVASHGGFFTLLDVQENTVYVELGGGCQGCGMANVTLRQGVEERLREVLPEMVALVDQTDHAAGTNPYYQASKK